MGLFARLTALDETKILVHRFGAALREWADGGLTRAEVIAMFNLTGDDVTQLDALRATYQAMPSGTTAAVLAKAAFLSRMEDVFELCERGDYDEPKARNRLGF